VRRTLLLPLGLGVTGLLVVAALASRGRPLGGGGYGGGPSAGFFDYVYTSVVIVAVAVALIVIWAYATNKQAFQPRRSGRQRLLTTLAFFAGCALLAWLISTSGFQRRLRAGIEQANRNQPKNQTAPKQAQPHGNVRGAHLRWDEVAIVLALLGALGVVALRARGRRAAPRSWRRASQAAISAALDESLDDLRSEPDLRKAIIAAYARMERSLGLAGLERRPAEAPLEYVERALGELETSAGAIRRLTDLFEWAKFSHHEPEPRMRDEAIDALVAVRDELRSRTEEPVPA
jgi:hypothetical protein